MHDKLKSLTLVQKKYQKNNFIIFDFTMKIHIIKIIKKLYIFKLFNIYI